MTIARADRIPPPLKVMHLLYELNLGGTEVGVVNLANLLPREEIATSICSTVPPGDLQGRLQADIAVHSFNRRPGQDPKFVYQLYRLLRRERPDVVHTHSWGTLCEGFIAARAAGVPCLVHGEHGTLELRPRTRAVQRWTWGRFDRVLSVSSRLADRMAAEIGFPRERIHVIRNGVNQSRFTAANAAHGRELIGAVSGPVLTIVGRLVPVKGHEVFLKSLATLRTGGVRFTGVIAGDGGRRAELERLASELGVSKDVRFLGHCERIPDLLAASDALVLSSHSEGLSNAILEGMAAGLAIAATNVGGADELVTPGVHGFLVPPNDPDAMANALRRLIDDPALRRQMGDENRRTVAARFTMARMVADYRDMYFDVAGRAPQTLTAHSLAS